MRKIYKILPIMILAGCSVGPDYERPEFWSDEELVQNLDVKNEEHKINKNWYEVFGDSELNMLVEETLKNSLNIKIAISKLRQARYNLDINRVNYFPMIDGGGEYNYAYAPKYGEFGNKSSYFHVGLDASWEIDIWGEGRRETESYGALYRAAAANMENVLLSITAEVVNNYVLLLTTHNQLQIAKRNLKLQRDILQMVREKYKSGLSEESDLNQAEFAVQSTKAKIPDLETNESIYQRSIAILMGKLPNNTVKIKDNNIVSSFFAFDIKKLREFPINVVRNRPDVRGAEEMLKSKNANVGKAIASMFPNISLSAVLGRQSHRFDGLNYAENAAYAYNPILNMPFLHWGQLLNEVRLSKSIKEEYLYDYEAIMLKAINEIKNAMTTVEKEYDKNKYLQTAVIDMRKVLEAVKIKYKEGLVEFSDLLSSEKDLLAAEDNLAVSNGTVCRNIVGFYKAIGGGYY